MKTTTGEAGPSKRIGKKPFYPPRPKRPLKPKSGAQVVTHSDLTIVAKEEEAGSEIEAEVAEESANEEDLVDSMRALDIAYFAEVCTLIYEPAV